MEPYKFALVGCLAITVCVIGLVFLLRPQPASAYLGKQLDEALISRGMTAPPLAFSSPTLSPEEIATT